MNPRSSINSAAYYSNASLQPTEDNQVRDDVPFPEGAGRVPQQKQQPQPQPQQQLQGQVMDMDQIQQVLKNMGLATNGKPEVHYAPPNTLEPPRDESPAFELPGDPEPMVPNEPTERDLQQALSAAKKIEWNDDLAVLALVCDRNKIRASNSVEALERVVNSAYRLRALFA